MKNLKLAATMLLPAGAFAAALLVLFKAMKPVPASTVINQTIMLSIAVWATLYFFQFKALRRLEVFCAWSLVALFMGAIALWMRGNSSLYYYNRTGTHHASAALYVPVGMLIFYQVCRQISLKRFGNEPSYVRKYSNKSYDEDRNGTWIETVLTMGFSVAPAIGVMF